MSVRATSNRLACLLLTIVVLATACSGSDDATAEIEGQPAEDQTEGTQELGESSADDDAPGEATGTVAAGNLDPWTLIAPTPPAELPVVAVSVDAPTQIASMLRDISDFVVTDPRSPDGGMLDVLEERRATELTPDLVLAIFASVIGNGADTYGIVEAHSAAAIDAGFDSEYTPYFDVRRRAANTLRSVNLSAYDILMRSRDVSIQGRECLVGYLLDGQSSCDEDADADALMDEFDAAQDVDLPDELDDADDQLFPIMSLCDVWVELRVELGDQQLERMDRLIDRSLLDDRFLGRNECRRGEGLDDVEWDREVDAALFGPVYDAVVVAGTAAEFDQAADELEYQESLAIQRVAMAEVSLAAAEVATATWRDATEPNARFGLLTVAYVGSTEAWFQQTVIDGGFDQLDDPYQALFDLVDCGPPASGAGNPTACVPGEPEINIALTSIDLGRYDYRMVAAHPIIDWEDVAPRLGLCEKWGVAFAAAPADAQDRINFQLGNLGLDELLGVDECVTGGDDSSVD